MGKAKYYQIDPNKSLKETLVDLLKAVIPTEFALAKLQNDYQIGNYDISINGIEFVPLGTSGRYNLQVRKSEDIKKINIYYHHWTVVTILEKGGIERNISVKDGKISINRLRKAFLTIVEVKKESAKEYERKKVLREERLEKNRQFKLEMSLFKETLSLPANASFRTEFPHEEISISFNKMTKEQCKELTDRIKDIFPPRDDTTPCRDIIR